jgi:hypothetical protein
MEIIIKTLLIEIVRRVNELRYLKSLEQGITQKSSVRLLLVY